MQGKAGCCVGVVAIVVAWLLFSVPSVKAQFSSGIEGIVSDTSSAMIPNAKVTVTNVATGVPRVVTANEAGYFRVTNLAAGAYSINIEAQGFKSQTLKDLVLEVDQIRSVPVTLEVGSMVTRVTVQAAAQVVDTSQSRVSSDLPQTMVQEMPLVGRNIYSLTALTAGITGTGGQKGGQQAVLATDNFSNEPGVGINAAGQRQESNVFLLDGSYVTSEPAGGIVNLSPNPDTVQEVRVTANNFSAEQGRNSGAMIEVFTKYGTNGLHGTLSWFHTNNVLQARTYPWGAIPAYRRNEFNVTVGGPIKKDKTFFFGSFNPLRSSIANRYLDTVETPEFRQYVTQNFPNTIAAQIFQSAPPAAEPTSDIQTVSEYVAANPGFFPAPAIPGELPAIGTASISQTLTRNGWQWSGRLDHNMREGKDRFYGQVFRVGVNQLSPFTRPSFNYVEPLRTLYTKFSHAHIFSPTILNEFAVTYMRVQGSEPGNQLQIPNIDIAGVSGFGTWAPGVYIQNNYEWRDVLNWNRGKHGLKFGAEFRRGHDDMLFADIYNRPSYSFANLLDFAQDKPFSQSGPVIDPKTGGYGGLSTGDRTLYKGFFVQDDWKVRPNLTLNVGLRIDDYGHLGSAKPYVPPIFQFGAGETFVERLASGFADVRSNHKGSLSRVWGLAPRLGFAWSPFGSQKTAVRGGYGVYYDRIPNQGWFNPIVNNPPLVAALSTDIRQGGQVAYALGTTQGTGFPIPAGVSFQFDPRNGILALDPATGQYVQQYVDVGGVDGYIRPPQVQNWMIGVQREILPDLVLEVDYLGSVGHRLYLATNINRFPGDLVEHLGNLTRINPSFSSIDFFRTIGNSASHNVTFGVTKRMSHQWTLRALYTYGKVLDYTSTSGSVSGTSVLDATNIRAQRGPADFDLRQKLAIQSNWTLPNPWKEGFRSKLFGGWELGGIATLQTGPTFTVITSAPFNLATDAEGNLIYPLQNVGGDYNADGFSYDVPDTPAFGNHLSKKSRSDYIAGVLDPSDFPRPALGREGNLGRNTFTGPGFANVDFSIIKNSKIPWWAHEGANFQFRTEFFNLFNRVNLSGVENDLTSSDFGRATNAFTARAVQFGIRIVY